MCSSYAKTYWEKLFQSATRKYCIQLWAHFPLRQQGEDYNIVDQCTGTADKFTVEWPINAQKNFSFFFIYYWTIIWQGADVEFIGETTTAKRKQKSWFTLKPFNCCRGTGWYIYVWFYICKCKIQDSTSSEGTGRVVEN